MNLSLVLELEPRAPGHSNVTKARQNGEVPGVLYGQAGGPLLVQVPVGALQAVVAQGGEHHPFTAKLPDGTTQLAMVREVQRETGSHKPNHVDFLAVTQEEKVTVTVPVVLHGEQDLLRRGLKALLQIYHVNVHGTAADLPDAVEVDVSHLLQGDAVHIGDLKVTQGVTIVEPATHVVFSVIRAHRVHEEEKEKSAPAISPGPQAKQPEPQPVPEPSLKR